MERKNREQLLATLETWAGRPEEGLPLDLFRVLSRIVPLVNIDLLIRDERLGTLLTWRHDENYGPGWHIPGGIIRYKETAATRIQLTAQRELGTGVDFEPEPMCVREAIDPVRRERGHFISLLYRCRLQAAPAGRLRAGATPQHGQWAWHRTCPPDLIPEHDDYRRFF